MEMGLRERERWLDGWMEGGWAWWCLSAVRDGLVECEEWSGSACGTPVRSAFTLARYQRNLEEDSKATQDQKKGTV